MRGLAAFVTLGALAGECSNEAPEAKLPFKEIRPFNMAYPLDFSSMNCMSSGKTVARRLQSHHDDLWISAILLIKDDGTHERAPQGYPNCDAFTRLFSPASPAIIGKRMSIIPRTNQSAARRDFYQRNLAVANRDSSAPTNETVGMVLASGPGLVQRADTNCMTFSRV